MQNPIHDQHINPGKSRLWAWLRENLRIFILIVALLAVSILALCPGIFKGEELNLSFDPMTGAVVDDLTGNKDGQLNPGEQVKVRLRLTNTGDKPIPGFVLVLSPQATGVTFIDQDNRVRFPAIEPRQTVLSEDPFEFKLDTSFVSDCVVFLGKVEKPARAGLVGESSGQEMTVNGQVFISLAVVSNYRVCMLACTLKEGRSIGEGVFDPDTLKIDLLLCNASGGTLNNPSMRVDSITVKRCNQPGDSFTVVREVVTGFTVNLDSLWHANPILADSCKKPTNPTNHFKLKSSLAPLTGVDKVCVYFTALVYNGGATPIARAFIGTEADVIH